MSLRTSIDRDNLTKDLNKCTTNISYNSLSLPQVVTFSNGSTITYLYTADGRKLRTVHVTNGTATTTDYCGNVIYENGTQKLLLTEEGYVDLVNSNTYYYYLKDHQGNNRVVVSSSGTVMETNHYYPFGGVFSTNTNVQPYKYNGKELDSKNGLNWYDYGARHYDAALGRWHVVDPLAEKYYPSSPFVYCDNNPINRIDTNGMLYDDYRIYESGNIEVTRTSSSQDNFYLIVPNKEVLVASFEKNSYNLIQLYSFSYSDPDLNIDFGINVKEGNQNNAYIRGDALASLIGAAASTNNKDIMVIGFSEYDGSSPKPSISHKDGKNGDLRYLRTDMSGDAVLLGSKNLDIKRQNLFNEALYKFGWKSMLSERFVEYGTSDTILLKHTQHYNRSRHHNHLHIQGYRPKIKIKK